MDTLKREQQSPLLLTLCRVQNPKPGLPRRSFALAISDSLGTIRLSMTPFSIFSGFRLLYFHAALVTASLAWSAFSAPAAESDRDAIARATAAVQAAASRAQADPAHPLFHVTAPAQWINDPNGPIYYRGFYHLFYQLHPFSDGSGPKYWGHVRSRDLVKWEPLPIALAPSADLGESEIWSGCCTINGRSKPMIFYTSIAPGKSASTHAEQWAAIGDDNLITWRKCPQNPVLSEALHDGRKIYDWRDPFIFHYRKQTFLVTGGNLNEAKGGQATVNIYEAQNPDLTQWKYRGVLFQIPDQKARTAECPNFFQLGNRWVLFVSPYGKVQYFVGDFDPATCRFQPATHGLLDVGPHFYAPNTMLLSNGRRLVWGWINGFREGNGWNGCLSIPRELSLSRDGELRQSPAPELRRLRGRREQWRNVRIDPASPSFTLPRTNTLEIQAGFDLQSAEGLALTFTSESQKPLTIALAARDEKTNGPRNPDLSLSLNGPERKLNVLIFIDRSVLEVFVNDTICATKVIPLLGSDTRLQIQAVGGKALAEQIQCWPML
jgi:beta-fructofuranosidase